MEILAKEVMVFLLVAIGVVAKLLQFILGLTLLVMFVKPVAYRRRGHALRNAFMFPLVVHLFAIFLQGGQKVGIDQRGKDERGVIHRVATAGVRG